MQDPEKINYDNLKRMFNYILVIPYKRLNMKTYRPTKSLRSEHACKSVGCIIGHCTILDKWERIPKYPDNEIKFTEWSEDFTGLQYLAAWKFCFGSSWADNYKTNSKTQILARLKYFIDNKKVHESFSINSFSFLPSNMDDCYHTIIPITKKELKPYII